MNIQMPKYHHNGASIDQINCTHCDRMYRGDTGTVKKLMTLHMLKEHGITDVNLSRKPDTVTYTLNHKNPVVGHCVNTVVPSD